MLEWEILRRFLIALVLGSLIGLEREYSQVKKHIKGFAGIRTFPLIALFGALIAYFTQIISVWVFVAGLVIIAGLIFTGYYYTSKESKYHGLTSAFAALVVYFLGVLCIYDKMVLAVVIAVGTATLLYARNFLHHFAEKIKKKELADTLKFIIIAFVILPFLPDKSYGLYGIFNPFIFWLIVVFVSGISFMGYILMKFFDKRGLEMTGIFGGLVSSTIITTNFARHSRKESWLYPSLILGVILANSVMFIRILVEVFVINQNLFLKMLLPMLILTLASALSAYFFWRKVKSVKQGKLELTSPFTLGPALKFALFFALVLALTKIADIYLSSKGVYLVSIFSGFVGVDAIAVSLSQLAQQGTGETIARNGIILAALSNLAVKGGIAYIFGSKQFGRTVLLIFSTLIVMGLGLIFLL